MPMDIDVNELHEGSDWALEHLNKLSLGGVELAISLFVGGTVVSGFIIPSSKYFDTMSTYFSEGIGDEELASALEMFWQNHSNAAKSEAGDRATTLSGEAYIHLRDVHVLAANGQLSALPNGAVWRGKVASVDGFFLGRVRAVRKFGK